MGIKITDMTDGAPADGTEIIPTSKAAAPRRITVDNIVTFVLSELASVSAAAGVATADKVYILDDTDSTVKPVALETALQHGIDIMWGKVAEASPDDADILLLKDGGSTEKTVTAAVLAEYVRAQKEAAILEFSSLGDGSGAFAAADLMVITQAGVGMKVTAQDVIDLVYAGLAAYVGGLTASGVVDAADTLYLLDGGTTPKEVTAAQLATFMAASAAIDGSGTAGVLAKWADSDTLQAGETVTTSASGFTAGSDVSIPTSKAVRDEMDAIVTDATDIGAALVPTDEILVFDQDGTGHGQRKAAISRLKGTGVQANAATDTLLAAVMYDYLHTNTGAAGAVILTCPAGVAGYRVRFIRTAAFLVTVRPEASEQILWGNGLIAAGTGLELGALGSGFEMEHDGTYWCVVNTPGGTVNPE